MNIEILVSCMRARISPCTHLHEYQPAQMCEYTCAMCEIVTNSFCAVLPMQGLRVKKNHCEQHGQQHKRQSDTAALCLIASHCFGRWEHKRRPKYSIYSMQPPVWECMHIQYTVF